MERYLHRSGANICGVNVTRVSPGDDQLVTPCNPRADFCKPFSRLTNAAVIAGVFNGNEAKRSKNVWSTESSNTSIHVHKSRYTYMPMYVCIYDVYHRQMHLKSVVTHSRLQLSLTSGKCRGFFYSGLEESHGKPPRDLWLWKPMALLIGSEDISCGGQGLVLSILPPPSGALHET